MNVFYKLNINIDDEIYKEKYIIENEYWNFLLQNPNVMFLIEDNLDKIKWKYLSSNPGAIHLLKANFDKIDWNELSRNPNAIELLQDNPNKIRWDELSKNPNAIHLLETNVNKINWFFLSQNPNAVKILEKNLDKVYNNFSKNPNSIELIKAYPKLIDWVRLSENPNAISILKANPNKICWKRLSKNSKAMHLLEANPDKIDLDFLSSNPNVKAIDFLKNLDKINIEDTHVTRRYTIEMFKDITSAQLFYSSNNLSISDTINLFSNYGKIKLILDVNAYNYRYNNLLLNPNILSLILEWDYIAIKTHFYNSYGKELIEWIYNPIRNEKWGKNCWDLD